MIRAIKENDIEQLKEIWNKFYRNEIQFPNFFDKYLCAFVVIENDMIISAGGVRTIVESVVLTDKNQSVRKRMRALFEILEASKFVASRNGYNNLNAFIHDQSWKKHLINIGFKQESILSLEL